MKAHQKYFGPVVQLVSTPACHAGGQGFEPPPGRHQVCGSDNRHCHIFQKSGLYVRTNQKSLRLAYNDDMIYRVLPLHYASVAQVVEQGTENPCVGGSSPPRGTNN